MRLDRSTVLVAAVLGSALVAGCSGEKADSAQPATETGQPGKSLFDGTKITLPAPLAGVRLRGPVADGKTGAPWLFAKLGTSVPVPGFDGVLAGATLSEDEAYVHSIRVELAKYKLTEARGFLELLWGTPREAKTKYGDPMFHWLNPEAGLHVSIEPTNKGGTSVVFDPMMSVASFLGTEPGRFGFERLPLLGASLDDIKKAYGGWIGPTDDKQKLAIELPPFELEPGWCFVSFKDGKAEKLTVMISFSWDELGKKSILTALEEKFGKPTKKATADDPNVELPGPPKVKIDTSGERKLVIWVG